MMETEGRAGGRLHVFCCGTRMDVGWVWTWTDGVMGAEDYT